MKGQRFCLSNPRAKPLIQSASVMNPFYNEYEERPRTFWRLLFQLALYFSAVAFSRLVALSVWVALYRRVVDPGAPQDPGLIILTLNQRDRYLQNP
jgi:hypothetical protein